MISDLLPISFLVLFVGFMAMLFVWFSAKVFVRMITDLLNAVFVTDADKDVTCPHCGRTLIEEEEI